MTGSAGGAGRFSGCWQALVSNNFLFLRDVLNETLVFETCLIKRTGSAFICSDIPVGSHKSVRHRGRQRGTEIEIGGYRVMVRQCSSDRPSFLLEYNCESSGRVEHRVNYGMRLQASAPKLIP